MHNYLWLAAQPTNTYKKCCRLGNGAFLQKIEMTLLSKAYRRILQTIMKWTFSFVVIFIEDSIEQTKLLKDILA